MANRTISTKVLNVVYTTDQLAQEPVSTTVISKGLLVIENTTDGKITKSGNAKDLIKDNSVKAAYLGG